MELSIAETFKQKCVYNNAEFCQYLYAQALIGSSSKLQGNVRAVRITLEQYVVDSVVMQTPDFFTEFIKSCMANIDLNKVATEIVDDINARRGVFASFDQRRSSST